MNVPCIMHFQPFDSITKPLKRGSRGYFINFESLQDNVNNEIRRGSPRAGESKYSIGRVTKTAIFNFNSIYLG